MRFEELIKSIDDAYTELYNAGVLSESTFVELYRSLEEYIDDNNLLYRWGDKNAYLAKDEKDFEIVSVYVKYGATNRHDRMYNPKLAYPRMFGWYEGPGWYVAERRITEPQDSHEVSRIKDIRMKLIAPYITVK